MRFATSFFNKTVFRTDYRRYWPVLVIYTGLWMALPITQWNAIHYIETAAGGYNGDRIYRMLPSAVIMAVIFGCAMAMMVFSYLMNSRSVGLMHSLPVRRSALFITHVVSGLSMFVLGNLTVTAVTALVLWTTGSGGMRALVAWFWVSTALDFIFFSLAVLCCMLTGWLLASPVLYAALNGGAAVITVLMQALGGLFYFGYAGDTFPAVTEWLTPAVKLISGVNDLWYRTPQGPVQSLAGTAAGQDTSFGSYVAASAPVCLSPQTVQTIWIYLAAALVLLVLSALLYRSRPSESAGSPVAFRWARPIFRYGIALAGGLALGLVLYQMVTVNSDRPGANLPVLLICLAAMALVSYFAVSMIIEKSFRVFRGRRWLGAAAVCVVLAVLTFVLRADPTGYVRHVPAAEDVKSTEMDISSAGIYQIMADDGDLTTETLAIHEGLVEYGREPLRDEPSVRIRINYELRSGGEIKRDYTVSVTALPQSVQKRLDGIANSEKMRTERIMGTTWPMTPEKLTGGYVETFKDFGDNEIHQLTAGQARQLGEAVMQDIRAGAGALDLGGEFSGNTFQPTIVLGDDGAGTEWYVHTISEDCTETIRFLTEEIGLKHDEIFR